ncbi:MAG: hypothetical protein JO327_10625, partial [Nitrososphaeraceae archaeon]|nr:hypothetical protein [Nitrososphaeraceae archaeon]
MSKHHDDDKPYPKSREVMKEEREEAKRRIFEDNPHISKDTLEFMLSLPVPKVMEMETIHATAEQQEEMERLLKVYTGNQKVMHVFLKTV